MITDPKKRFYLVFCPDGPGMPSKIHDTHQSAFFECHRMSKLHPGKQFFVLSSASKPIIVADETAESALA